MVTYFKQSTTAKAELNDLQKKDPDVIAILGLIQGLKTGWNSDHDMIVRFIKLKTKLAPVVMKHQNCPPMPSNLGVRLLDSVVELLSPLTEFSKAVSSDCEVTSSIVIPYKNNLFEEWEKMNYVNCEAMNASDNLIAEDMFDNLKNNLMVQGRHYFDPLEYIEEFAISTFLDPRFKTEKFEDIFQRIKQELNVLMEDPEHEEDNDVEVVEVATISTPVKKGVLWKALVDEFPLQGTSSTKTAMQIINSYMLEIRIHPTSDPSVYWEDKRCSLGDDY